MSPFGINQKKNAPKIMLKSALVAASLVAGLSACQTTEALDAKVHDWIKGEDTSSDTSNLAQTESSRSDSPSSDGSTKAESSQETASVPSGINQYVDQNNSIVRRYQSALTLLLNSQVILKDALGISEEGQRISTVAKNLGEGTVDKDELERATALTAENNILINEKISEGNILNSASKAKYASALPSYARGTFESYMIIPEATAFASQITSTASQMASNPMAAFELIELTKGAASGLYVASNLPSLLSQWVTNTNNLITFGQKNDVDVSSAQDVMGNIAL